jgi:hypothetical protein
MKTSIVIALLACAAISRAEETVLYSTSFEQQPAGIIESYQDGAALWKSVGKSEITSKYHKTGKQCLRIFGGEDNSLEVELSGELRGLRGITFAAERWTARQPFAFRIEALVEGRWSEIANLDPLVVVGRGFHSAVGVKVPARPVAALRFRCSAPEDAGVLIDDLKLLAEEPARISKLPEVADEPIRRIVTTEDLFISGTENTHTFRIPAIITAMNGDLIAACDARRASSADLKWVRDIDIVVKRSTDNGETWSDMEIICDYGDGKPASDPSLILDRSSGEIFCFYNYMDQDKSPGEFRLYVQSSRDHGKTWTAGRDITDSITKPAWRRDFKFITSGRGIQRANGELMHTLVNLQHGVHLFYSDDHGQTWDFIDSPIKPADESKVVELVNGDLMVNARINSAGYRGVHRSSDNGRSWTFEADRSQVDPGCNGSIIRYTFVKDGYSKNRLLLCHANSFSGRKNLALRISYDEGETWSKGRVIDPGPSAYSSLTILEDGSIGILYEPGYGAVRFVRVTLEDLTDCEDRLERSYEH